MGSCAEYEELISAWIDGLLSEEDRQRLMAHLAECDACQASFDDQLSIHAAMAPSPISAPAGFAEGVMARVRETPQEKSKIRPLPRWRQWAALAACCALAAAGLWGLQRQGYNQAAGQAEDCSLTDAGPAENGAPRDAELTGGADAPAGLDGGAPEEKMSLDSLEEAVSQAEADSASGTPAAAGALSEVPGAAPERASGEPLLDCETASALFGHPLVPCTAENFEGFSLGTVSDGRGGEALYVYAAYHFSNGDVFVRDQDREGSLPVPEDCESIASGEETFLVRDASYGGGRPVVLYLPNGETGLAYSARFEPSVAQESVFALLLSLKIP